MPFLRGGCGACGHGVYKSGGDNRRPANRSLHDRKRQQASGSKAELFVRHLRRAIAIVGNSFSEQYFEMKYVARAASQFYAGLRRQVCQLECRGFWATSCVFGESKSFLGRATVWHFCQRSDNKSAFWDVSHMPTSQCGCFCFGKSAPDLVLSIANYGGERPVAAVFRTYQRASTGLGCLTNEDWFRITVGDSKVDRGIVC